MYQRRECLVIRTVVLQSQGSIRIPVLTGPQRSPLLLPTLVSSIRKHLCSYSHVYTGYNNFVEGVDDFTNTNSSPSSKSRFLKVRTKSSAKGTIPKGNQPSRSPEFMRDALPHTESSIMANNVEKFSSVPLNEGLLQSLEANLGQNALPTDIQRLSLSHFFKRNPGEADPSPIVQREKAGSITLLASQTGSGKSIAYLLPMLHSIKWAELKAKEANIPDRRTTFSPKGLVLAPTHELARQLSRFAKSLSHNIKLRVLCLSQANNGTSSSSLDKLDFSHLPLVGNSTEFEIHPMDLMDPSSSKGSHPVDVMMGTTARVLDLARGRQWRDEISRLMERNPWEKDADGEKERLVRANPPGWKPSLDLSAVEWVVMDEADVVYGPDFIHSTELLLNDITAAKAGKSFTQPGRASSTAFPFNLILCSATIPNLLNHYITTHYPHIEKLTSIRLHNLPSSITPEHVPYSGGNRAADIAARLRAVWAEDAQRGKESKVLLFCNKSSKVEGLAQYLNERGIPSISLVRAMEKGTRARNNDKAIEGFLKSSSVRKAKQPEESDEEAPRVLVTTSLLSRGLDFNDSVRHVFIIDEPRNMVDFLHRAGRTGRAGQKGKVVIFSKSRGRGSARSRTGVRGEIMQKIGLRPRRVLRRPAEAFAY